MGCGFGFLGKWRFWGVGLLGWGGWGRLKLKSGIGVVVLFGVFVVDILLNKDDEENFMYNIVVLFFSSDKFILN